MSADVLYGVHRNSIIMSCLFKRMLGNTSRFHIWIILGMKPLRFVGATLSRDSAPEAHFDADFYPLDLERIVVACKSGFPLPASSGLLPARPTHALRTLFRNTDRFGHAFSAKVPQCNLLR